MSQIHLLCDSILAHLTALGRPTASSMLPGMTESQIRQLTNGLPFALTQSAFEIYKWSAGLKPGSGVGNDFFPGYAMGALPEMVEIYRELSNHSEFPRFQCGSMHWFPIFQSGGADFYGVLCREDSVVDGEVVNDDNEGEHRDCITPPPVEFVSLEAMLRTMLRAFETGVYYVDDKSRLTVGKMTYFADGPLAGKLKDVDISAFKGIARHFNPEVTYWK